MKSMNPLLLTSIISNSYTREVYYSECYNFTFAFSVKVIKLVSISKIKTSDCMVELEGTVPLVGAAPGAFAFY